MCVCGHALNFIEFLFLIQGPEHVHCIQCLCFDYIWKPSVFESVHAVLVVVSSALRSQDSRTMEAEGEEEEEGEGVSSTAGPQLAAGVTERSNSTSNGRSSQILYVITSSPGKPESNMPGQWAGRSETTGHSASMFPPMMHCTSLWLCEGAMGGLWPGFDKSLYLGLLVPEVLFGALSSLTSSDNTTKSIFLMITDYGGCKQDTLSDCVI